jgi:hypothetical protein
MVGFFFPLSPYRTKSGGILRRISDDFFSIGVDNPEDYVIECQSTSDNTIIIRVFQYISSFAIEGGEIEGNTLSIHIPAAGILFLRSTRNTPDQMNIRISAVGSSMEFTVPVLKVKDYNLTSIFKEKLFFLLPFYLFNYENRFSLYDVDGDARNQLMNEIKEMVRGLDDLTESGELSYFERATIILIFKLVVENLARNHEHILKGVDHIMGGKIIEYEAYNIYAEGKADGKAEGIKEGLKEGEEKGETKFGKLMLILLSNGLSSDMEKAVTDINVRKELYKKYKIDDAE